MYLTFLDYLPLTGGVDYDALRMFRQECRDGVLITVGNSFAGFFLNGCAEIEL